MATPAKLDLIRGEVTKVQFTSETHPVATRPGAAPQTRVLNKMRVFLREKAGAPERDFAFTNTTVGIHEGHTIAIARAARVDGFFGPRWKAFGMAGVLFVLGYIASRFIVSPDKTSATWISWPLFLAFLSFPAFWGGTVVWDRFAHGRTGRAEEDRLRTEITERLGKQSPPSPAGGGGTDRTK